MRVVCLSLRLDIADDTFPPVSHTIPPKEREFAGQMMTLIMRSFFNAYYMHANGVGETELLIDYDIEAAYNEVDEHLRDTIRNTIKSAVKAVDNGVDYATAQSYLNSQLNHRIDILLKPNSRKRKTLEACVGAAQNIGLAHIICPWCGGSVPVDEPLHDCQQSHD